MVETAVARITGFEIHRSFRRFGGGALLLANMARALGNSLPDKQVFVTLRHQDNGSGKLIAWYQCRGFSRYCDVDIGKGGASCFPPSLEEAPFYRPIVMVAPLEKLLLES
jgi:hypothetical protein